jgi:2-hydroxychromene-2-carboxylate isomerase
VAGVLEFFFDYGSPYSYIADTQLADLGRRVGCRIEYVPMLLGGVFKATGNSSPAQESVESKRRYGAVEMQRRVAEYGIRFEANPHFPINTLNLMRHAHAALDLGVFPGFHAAVFPAFWQREKNLGDPDVLASELSAAGLDADALANRAGERKIKDALRERTDEAVARGAFGAPTFFVADEMFFGSDRLGAVEKALHSIQEKSD